MKLRKQFHELPCEKCHTIGNFRQNRPICDQYAKHSRVSTHIVIFFIVFRFWFLCAHNLMTNFKWNAKMFWGENILDSYRCRPSYTNFGKLLNTRIWMQYFHIVKTALIHKDTLRIQTGGGMCAKAKWNGNKQKIPSPNRAKQHENMAWNLMTMKNCALCADTRSHLCHQTSKDKWVTNKNHLPIQISKYIVEYSFFIPFLQLCCRLHYNGRILVNVIFLRVNIRRAFESDTTWIR